jgi:hypothetical protein
MEDISKEAKLYEALSKAQAQIKGAIKDSTNPFFKSSYADLQSVWDACREALTTNGLCVIQTTEMINEKVYVKTILAHKDGGSIYGILPIRAKDESAQSQGSGISYARRYALAAMVGVYQTDDDAEGATHREKPKAEKETLDMGNDEELNNKDAKIKVIYELTKKAGFTPEEMAGYIKTKYNKSGSKYMTIAELDNLIEYLKRSVTEK